MQQYLQNKKGLVQGVFDNVYDKYDLMNDSMSLGVHRIWKRDLMSWMNPSKDKILIDVACGTGDLGKLFLDLTNKDGKIFCVDPNKGMIGKGKTKLTSYKNIKKSINVVTGSICIFPASLLHYTVPFESNEERIVLAFDVIPKN